MKYSLNLFCLILGHYIAEGYGWSCPANSTSVFVREIQNVELRFNVVISATSTIYTYKIWSPTGVSLLTIAYYSGNVLGTLIVNNTYCTLISSVEAGELYIILKAESPGGIYRLEKSPGVTTEKCFTVYVLGKPALPLIYTDKNPSVGESVTITCSSTSTTTPKLSPSYDWVVDGLVNPNDLRFTYSSLRQNITIAKFGRQDTGKQWTCIASEHVANGYTSDRSNAFHISATYGPDSVTFTPANTNYEIEENSYLDPITCTADCHPACSFIWTKKETADVISNTALLQLATLQIRETGTYLCTARRPGSYVSYTAEITLFVTSKGMTCPANSTKLFVRKIQDTDLRFDYDTTATSIDYVYKIWSPTDINLLSLSVYNDSLFRNLAVNDLYCTSVGSVDDGELYVRLKAGNTAGVYRLEKNVSVVTCVTVHMLGKPTLPSISKEKDPSVGDNLTVMCSSTSMTTPRNHGLSLLYDWIVDGVVNPTESRFTYSTLWQNLTIANFVKQDSCKQVTCAATEANNGYTSVRSNSLMISVLYGPDSITFTPGDTSYEREESFNLSDVVCNADCNPACSFQWTKNETSEVISNTSTLQLGTLQIAEAGTYVCIATRPGSSVSTTAELSLSVKSVQSTNLEQKAGNTQYNVTITVGVVLGIVIVGLAVCSAVLLVKLRRSVYKQGTDAARKSCKLPMKGVPYAIMAYAKENIQQQGNEQYSSLDSNQRTDISAYDVIRMEK